MYSHTVDVSQQLYGNVYVGQDFVQSRVNGPDWDRTARAYHPELRRLYHELAYAHRHVPFEYALDDGPMKRAVSDVGHRASFKLVVTVIDAELFEGKVAKPWAAKALKKRIMVKVDPEWPHWYASLVNAVANHAGHALANLEVVLYSFVGKRKLSSDKKILVPELIDARENGIYAVVKVNKTARSISSEFTEIPAYAPRQLTRLHKSSADAISSEFSSAALAKKSKARRRGTPVAAITSEAISKPPTKPLVSIASKLTERIGEELLAGASRAAAEHANKDTAAKSVKNLIRDPVFVHDAIHRAVMDDKVYIGEGVQSATAYWENRGINIGDVITAASAHIGTQLHEVKPAAFFAAAKRTLGSTANISDELGMRKKTAFSEEIARKALSAATINCGLWDSFLHVVGYHGTHDDGGHDLGPCASLTKCANVRAGGLLADACEPSVEICPPKVHRAPRHCPELFGPLLHRHNGHHHSRNNHHHDDNNIVVQSVVIDVSDRHRSGRRHRHTKRVVHDAVTPSAAKAVIASKTTDVFSDSSDDESLTLDRAKRRSKGRPFRSTRSPADSDDSGDDLDHSKLSTVLSTKTTMFASVSAKTSAISSEVYLNEGNFSNFLYVLKRSRDVSKMPPCVVMCMDNTVLHNKNLEVIKKNGGDAACAKFMKHYVCIPRVGGRHHHGPFGLFGDLIDKAAGKVVFIAESAVYWAIHVPSHTLIAAAHAAHEIAHGHLLVKPHLLRCRGFPEHVRFVHVGVTHRYMPRE